MCAWPTALPATRVVLGFCVALPDSVPVAPAMLGLPSGAVPSPVSPWEVAAYMECAVWTGGTRCSGPDGFTGSLVYQAVPSLPGHQVSPGVSLMAWPSTQSGVTLNISIDGFRRTS